MRRVLAAIVLSLATFGFAFAQTETPPPPALTLSTAFPGQDVRAGESVSISLDVRNTGLPGQTIELELQEVPAGWTAKLQGGGRVVHSVYVETDSSRSLTLSLDVPSDAADGPHGVVVVAKGQTKTSTLNLTLTVGASAPPALSVKPDLPVLKGTSNTSFSYRLTIKNESEEDVLANLEAEAPDGWEVTFKKAFGGQELASLPIAANGSEQVDTTVRPASQTAAGEYVLTVRVQTTAASGETQLTAVVSGQPSLTLTTPDSRLSGRATAGRDTALELVLTNNGTAPAENIKLEASPPSSWKTTFEPETVVSLAPGEQVQVIAHITPADQAVAGDYQVTMRAIPEGGGTESADFRITVTTSTLWGVVGLVLIAAALGVVALAVARFGRR